MTNLGYSSVPSQTNPDPNGGGYYSGGYNTQRHGSKNGGTIDAIQIESPRDVRFGENGRDIEVYAKDLATSMVQFYKIHYEK